MKAGRLTSDSRLQSLQRPRQLFSRKFFFVLLIVVVSVLICLQFSYDNGIGSSRQAVTFRTKAITGTTAILNETTSTAPPAANATALFEFTGHRIRRFSGPRLNLHEISISTNQDRQIKQNYEVNCSIWIVNLQTTAASTVASMEMPERWCIVVVLTDSYDDIGNGPNGSSGTDGSHIHFLALKDFESWGDWPDRDGKTPSLRRLVNDLVATRSSTARSSATIATATERAMIIGYLYAMKHGARYIIDAADCGDQTPASTAATTSSILTIQELLSRNETYLEHITVPVVGPHVFNPYPLMAQLIDQRNKDTNQPSSTILKPKGRVPRQHKQAYETYSTHSRSNYIGHGEKYDSDSRYSAMKPPRGLPRKWVHDSTTYGSVAYQGGTIGKNQIATMQSVVLSSQRHKHHNNHNDDEATSIPSTIEPLLVPMHTFTPYYSNNLQQKHSEHQRNGPTLYTYQALWSLLLPLTVPRHASDIWRAYVSQAIFHELGSRIVMIPTSIMSTEKEGTIETGKRLLKRLNDVEYFHANTGDEFLEYDWKTTKLLKFLSSSSSEWMKEAESSSMTIAAMMESMWIELYERGYIEVEDVSFVQDWLKVLVELQYNIDGFVPSSTSTPLTPLLNEQPKQWQLLQRYRRYDRIVLMGQFNYRAEHVNDVIFWVQKWKERVSHVIVRGPFTVKQINELKAHGISAVRGRSDKGFVSPMENLMLTLLDYQKQNSSCGSDRPCIDGVLYVHDDAFLSLTQIFDEAARSEPTQIVTTCGLDGLDARKPINENDSEQREALSRVSYRIHQDGSYKKVDGFETTSDKELLDSLKPWMYNERCFDSFKDIARDPRATKYLELDGSFLVLPRGQADFLYVPITLAQAYAEAAEVIVEHDTFLECGLPKLIDMIRKTSTASIKVVDLCSNWNRNERGEVAMLNQCRRGMAMYHPFKLHVHGYRIWSEWFDFLS